MTDVGILPTPDRDSAPYWAALANGRLEIQQCDECGHWTWPPRPICSHCQSERLTWRAVAGTGEVHSWVVVHRSTFPGLAPLVPYTLLLVRLDEQGDILIPGRFVSDVAVHQGLLVRAAPVKVADDIGDIRWEAAATTRTPRT